MYPQALSLSSFWVLYNMNVSVIVTVSVISSTALFSSSFPFSVSDPHHSVFQLMDLSICIILVCPWFLLVCFSFQLLYSSPVWCFVMFSNSFLRNSNFSLFSFILILSCLVIFMTSLLAQTVKRLPPMRETQVRSLGREDPLEKETATHYSTLAWKNPMDGGVW